jgi:uncharacterized membrane protein
MSTPDHTTLIHLYRGELGRMTAYRIRLDTTTNWALGTSGAMVTFALGQPDVPHVVMLLPLVLCVVFVFLEARRLQDMEMIRDRVRWLETGYFAPALGMTPAEGWEDALAMSLQHPVPPITVLQAMSVRIRRNYLWVALSLYGAWWLKLSLAPTSLVEAAGFGLISGPVVIGMATALMVPWVVLAVTGERSTRQG